MMYDRKDRRAVMQRTCCMLVATLLLFHGVSAQSPATTFSAPGHREVIRDFFNRQAQVKYIYEAQVNAAGTDVVWTVDGEDYMQEIYVSPLTKPAQKRRITAFAGEHKGNETAPQWSPDNKQIAFLSEAATPGQLQVYIADAKTGKLVFPGPVSRFDGYVSHLKWSPDGKRLGILYVEKASREPSPMAAKDRATGLIDSLVNNNIQRIAVVDPGTGNWFPVSPPGLYVYEYDWAPDGKSFAYTAANPPGDNNWYIARLYAQPISSFDTVVLHQPERQIALPRWSPDGKQIAFIGGLMSDQGGTGGEIFIIPLSGKEKARNLTENRSSTPAWFTWRPDGNILFTEFTGGSVAINTLHTGNGNIMQVWKGDESIRSGAEETSLSVSRGKNPVVALIRSSWNRMPEVWAGELHRLKQITRLNEATGQKMPAYANVEWTNEGYPIQGWLLYPENYDPSKKYPMLVAVHGGPAWIALPTWSASDFNTTVYTRLGYFVFFPNARGSYGQGQKFTRANIRDWGYGDLRDILSGVEVVSRQYAVDTARVGILGWSYGGSMSMFAVTQTNRFKAAVAGAGAADWQSYYGQNSIDKFLWSYFGVSPYFDPAPYIRSSAMTFIKNVKTPTLVLVGELDGEAPAPQSFQFWHALKELGIPTQLKVYANEGHSFEEFENMIDVSVRTFEWFDYYLNK